MNVEDVLTYGHRTVLGSVEGLAAEEWEVPGACGVWSVKDIVAHLASYELLLVDICAPFLGGGPTPCLDRLFAQGDAFNDAEVAARRGRTPEEILAEYAGEQERAAALVARIPLERRRQTGMLPWYGAEYDLEDLLVYMFYGHKREHSAQIVAFRDRPAG